ncbi:MAG: DinB family protein [Chitinophagaceae bacterium]
MPLSASVLARLKHQHETLNELIKGLTEAQLKEQINPGKWSAFENIVHLTAYQPTFFHRLQLIASKENPLFERYVADNDPVFQQYITYSLKELLEDLSTQRFLINNHIINLSETTLRREGTHPLYGRFNISQWADFFLLHEAHHLFTIFMLTANLRKRIQQ